MSNSSAAIKLAKQRLSALQLAEALGNVSEACRRRGISRTQFYEYKRRFQTHGLEGLKDLPPVHRSQRLLKLEEQALDNKIELPPEQVEAIEKANPCFRERHVETSRPGELLCQDTFYVSHLKGVGRVYLQAVVDTYGSYAFGYLHTGKLPEHAATVLQNEVLPQYKAWNIQVSAILTDNGREYCGREHHPYELYLALNDIQHRTTNVGSPQTNGFVERFSRTVLDEFCRPAFRKKFYESTAVRLKIE